MSSLTAQLTVGHSDRYHDGIRPTHILWLSENSRPAWILQSVWDGIYPGMSEGTERPEWTEERIVWIPSAPEQILEDGLLMVSLHVVNDPVVVEWVQENAPDLEMEERIDLTEMPEATLQRLRVAAKGTEREFKLVVSVLEDSSLLAQLPVLEDYFCEVEVLTVSYSRLRRGFGGTGELEARGSLEPPPGTDHRYYEVRL